MLIGLDLIGEVSDGSDFSGSADCLAQHCTAHKVSSDPFVGEPQWKSVGNRGNRGTRDHLYKHVQINHRNHK